MTLVITATTLCVCRHIQAVHPDERACTECSRCVRFSPGSRYSSVRYQRHQRVASRRVARLEPGDRVLVGYPGHDETVRGPGGGMVWEQGPGELTSHAATRHIEDQVLRPVHKKTGALLGYVLGRRMLAPGGGGGLHRASPSLHVIQTDLGELPPMYGGNSVLVVQP